MKITRYKVFGIFFAAQFAISHHSSAMPPQTLSGHTLPPSATKGAKLSEPESPMLSIAVRLPMRNSDSLEYFLEHVYLPGDPLYGQFLTSDEFSEQFGATQEEVHQVVHYFNQINCKTGTIHKNLLLVDFECPRTSIEQTLNIKISDWITATNERIRTIDKDPTIPADLPVQAIHGLTSVPRHSFIIKRQDGNETHTIGSGPNGGLSPSDIKTAYNLNGTALSGAGQTLALFELDGYNSSDISKYKSQFRLPNVPLQNILVDGFDGSAGAGADEVSLDIELMIAIAPGTSKILVYEGPNTEAGVVDTYQKIANDNLARQISTSWGLAELSNTASGRNSENHIFQQMAAQGQSIYAASGDSGAFDDGSTLSVDDPASQPFMTGVGGTTLSVNPNHTFKSESTWWDPNRRIGSGGGISAVWPIQTWQVGAVSAASQGSTTARNVPDVSLNGDPNTGYAIFTGGQWQVFGGTSCSAPLWAAFTALANQKRATNHLSPLGFANPTLYQIGNSSSNATTYHDVANNSINGQYPAVKGYDLATGWGTFNGLNLLLHLSQGALILP